MTRASHHRILAHATRARAVDAAAYKRLLDAEGGEE